MTLFLQLIFFISAIGLVHSYVVYPLIMRWLASKKKPNQIRFQSPEEFPFLSVVMSLYNEESVIIEKLDSLYNCAYPKDKIHLFIGSDCSSDRTNELVQQYAKKYNNLSFFSYKNRRGKPAVLNDLTQEAFKKTPASPAHVLLITDANVILQQQTLMHLCRHFKNEKIAIVDSNMLNTGMQSKGISKSENQYITGEVRLKNSESVAWQKMIGPFGGCYALRSDFFTPIPTNFLVDDFYICLKVFEKGGSTINDLEAKCYEAVSHDIMEEYRRKKRISAGNYQNALTFKTLWLPPFTQLGFALFSHKILRWAGPYCIIFAFLASIILAAKGSLFFQIMLLGQVFVWGLIPLLDLVAKAFQINILPFRSIRYFLLMNIALLAGLFRFLKGVQSGAWEPPKRV